ncbi:MAG TPA: D-alanyl-D-alanine carboxypeptidase/D-alanyl-D-alanine-endopeptidase [Steroidobacteraceae bacterium]|nr:D-alanyl-D-alanine carboxypeptidase/D-alanyl-D-alanine-endopeptidase [Steroidobacteraceae bacterium]
MLNRPFSSRSWMVSLLVSAAAFAAFPAHAQWRALQALEQRGALVSAAAIDLDDHNTVIEELDSTQRLTPASLTKLATAALALQTWPADKMFDTHLLANAPIVRGRVTGDLILEGAGDPSLDDQSLWQLAAQLRGAGVGQVSGDLFVDPAPFGVVTCETQDRCHALESSDSAYNAPLAAVGVDFGNWCVVVRPTSPGAAALVRGCGVTRLPIAVQGVIRTVGRGRRQTLWIERRTTPSGEDTLQVGGDVPEGDDQTVYRSMSNPSLGVGELLKETLHEIGVEVAGPVVVRAARPPAGSYALGDIEGLSLREQLGRMLRFSNNYIADVLTMDMAASVDDQPPQALATAGRLLSDFVQRVQARDRPASHVAPPLYSGSGLTTDNRLSANDLVRLLAYQYHDARRFPAFYGGLVVPRDAPFVFLRQGGAAWLDRVALKTGTLDEPRSVCGIAGYLRKRGGGWIAFAAIVNGGPNWKHVPLFQAIAAERTDIDSLLQKY